MSGLDEMLHKRLERIRAELNTYISRKYCGTEEHILSVPTASDSVDKKTAGISEKFLHFMMLSADDEEDYLEEDYLDEEDSCLKIPEEKTRPLEAPRYQAPAMPRKSNAANTAGSLRIPDFLMKSEHHQEIDKVLEQRKESFSAMLLRLIDEKGLKDSEVYKRANIDRRLFSKIRGDEEYVPSKKTAISFCLALQLEVDEAKKLLATAGYTLSESSKFDLIIMYLIENSEYNIHFANIVLDDYGEGTLSK